MNTIRPTTQFRSFALFAQRFERPPAITRPLSTVERVQQAMLVVDVHALHPVASPDAGLAYQPATLLALHLYCYAHDIYGSEEIEDAICRDATFRQICREEFPDARTIRRFRRDNSVAIHSALVEFLRLTAPNDGNENEQLVEEASRRIGKAMFMDSIEMAA